MGSCAFPVQIAFSVLLAGIRLGAQSTFATITGTVTDTRMAPIPNVTVIATHVATNISPAGVSCSNTSCGVNVSPARRAAWNREREFSTATEWSILRWAKRTQ